MSAANILITEAGLNEIINAEQNGTAPVVLTHVGFGTGQYDPTGDMTALVAEFKRLESIAGGDIGDNRLHITASDASSDAYTVYEVGIFTNSGTLFAVCSRTVPILQKASVSEAFLAIDIELTNINPDSITIGNTDFQLNGATETKRGIVELANEVEVQEGRDGSRVVTPKGLKTLTATADRRGLVELATVEEVAAGTDTERAVTPATLDKRVAKEGKTGLIELATEKEVIAGTDATKAVTSKTLAAVTANESRRGLIEIATSAEVLLGTDNTRAITAAGLKAKFSAYGDRRDRASDKPNYGLA